MKVVFRTDASLSIGSGHLMRCLALAAALRERGATCAFLCREHPGHRNDLVTSQGFALHPLPPPASEGADAASPPHAAWLGCPWREDAAQSKAIVAKLQPDWLIVDHYALDAAWERTLRPCVGRIMAIDDLADRPHDADLLLDQGLGRLESDYVQWVPIACRVLVGPKYALLRPEFGRLRPQSLARRHSPMLEHLLIAMGGVDAGNATAAVLDALPAAHLPADCRITIALGRQAPWREALRERVASCAWPCELRFDVQDMAMLLSECDLAIGAAGTAAWERCCLGVPSILVVLAENQRVIAEALTAAGGAQSIGTAEDIPAHLPDAVATAVHGGVLANMSRLAAGLCDGNGVARVLANLCDPPRMTPSDGRMRSVNPEDMEQLLRWRNHPDTRRQMFTRHEISASEHEAWLKRSLADPARHLFIVEAEGHPLGFVQFKEAGAGGVADWGFYAVPDAPKGSGRRLGFVALGHAFDVLGLHKVCGQALESNDRSIAMHRALGFVEEGRLRDQYFDGERYRTVLCFGQLASEWRLAHRGNT
ncbi:UDP-2,4-diacetamido-2,4,6-trideoxy-beta-L-altropyranose hydrolase [Frateuria edaphi]|uniref:UDP-2,4-diacetamido-2,4, 6-trideoxy-beta-L-altropyranose hydrolase n=1 Tax=Frateuria edaphi TaxID=2898793 RepID=UPI001E5F164C|nr:UDP-2,4-diacetamido-2,4,6-trideoxy-beta-L-altropyranose hydrolase [Frateuria edaphi]UGB46561.1 UDP-2,4-diacetamido-2,4,6-trideoxy-beta-L-altropyranose hydrolase [Frateuria edaphi]